LKIKNRLKDDLTAFNVAGAALVNILPEDDFYGGTCLFCGLKAAARVSAFFICMKKFNLKSMVFYGTKIFVEFLASNLFKNLS
jgi:hypothetical protein